jgi:hypothetical protein
MVAQYISRGKPSVAGCMMYGVIQLYRGFIGQKERPDLLSCISSGFFEVSAAVLESIAAAGTEALHDVDCHVLINALSILRNCSRMPECEARIRSLAKPLMFFLGASEPCTRWLRSSVLHRDIMFECNIYLVRSQRHNLIMPFSRSHHAALFVQPRAEHDVDWMKEASYSSSAVAAQVCCSIFGRDEGGFSDFKFTQHVVDRLVSRWTNVVQCRNTGSKGTPTAETVQAIELCISDENKLLLLQSPAFIPYLVDALLIRSDHPRAGLKPELKAWCQGAHAECLAQLAVFPEGKKALLREPSVGEALQVVADVGLTEAARTHAQSALLALSDKELQVNADGQKHVMLSCECQTASQEADVLTLSRVCGPVPVTNSLTDCF